MSGPRPVEIEREPLSTAVLRQRYGRGYFHGENSGFSELGYAAVHATWRHWMPFVRDEVGPGAPWLDLGCAYGFLVEEALEAGFRAFGVDASDFALTQARRHAPAAAQRSIAAHAEHLPFPDRTFAVVSAFDVLEHVPDPERLIAEAVRVLRPDGVFLAATPDPMVFDRHEPTHVAEHTPSWWVRALERCGLAVSLRFFQAPFNCEIVARRAGTAPRVTFDALGASDPTLAVSGGALTVAFRENVGALEPDRTRVLGHDASLYLLNRGDAPLDVSLKLLARGADRWSLRLGGRVLARFPQDAPQDLEAPGVRARFILPSGGHTLRLSIPGGWLHLAALRATATATKAEDLCSTLPFDLFERYSLLAAVTRVLTPDSAAILDVGGTIGADQAHLGWTGDFLPERHVLVTDARAADHAHHRVVAAGARLPFEDASFEVVSAQDVLEHVLPAQREEFLAELWRVAARFVLLGNPFATPGVEEADRYLFELIRTRYGYEHGFLAEHLGHALPSLDATRDFFAARGASVAVLPSGHLPAWLLLQTLNAELSHPEQDASYVLANRSVNSAHRPACSALPAYRHLLVIDRRGGDHSEALAPLRRIAPEEREVAAVLAAATSTSRRRA